MTRSTGPGEPGAGPGDQRAVPSGDQDDEARYRRARSLDASSPGGLQGLLDPPLPLSRLARAGDTAGLEDLVARLHDLPADRWPR